MRRHVAEIVQTATRYGQVLYGWVCPCGENGGPFLSLQTAVTGAVDHEQRHRRVDELTAERFMSGAVFS